VGWAAGLAGLVLGYMGVRIRRLKVASSLHAGVPKPHLAWQHLVETAIWALSATIVASAGLLWAARAGNPDPSVAIWTIGLRTVTAGAIASLIGAVIAVATTKESHLFKYFKDR